MRKTEKKGRTSSISNAVKAAQVKVEHHDWPQHIEIPKGGEEYVLALFDSVLSTRTSWLQHGLETAASYAVMMYHRSLLINKLSAEGYVSERADGTLRKSGTADALALLCSQINVLMGKLSLNVRQGEDVRADKRRAGMGLGAKANTKAPGKVIDYAALAEQARNKGGNQ